MVFTHHAVHASECSPLLQHRFDRLQDNAPQNLCQYSGKVVLVVNTASYCGFTQQYRGLEALHSQYHTKGLAILGFPSNDFGGQEPGDAKEIAQLCYNTFGVQFPMFAKTSVRGTQANALHAALAKASGQEPKWNFHKYLIARDGKTVTSFPSQISPDAAPLRKAIEQALAERAAP